MAVATSREFVDLLLSQDGDRYIFGVEVSPSDSNPKAFDCSELIQWGGARLRVSPTVPDGSWLQARHCKNAGLLIPINQAIFTTGALLFSFSNDPFAGGRPTRAHVAVSQGNGRTIEARSTIHGVGQFTAYDRGWTQAGLLPGIDYGDSDMSFTEHEEVVLKRIVKGLDNVDSDGSFVESAVRVIREERERPLHEHKASSVTDLQPLVNAVVAEVLRRLNNG